MSERGHRTTGVGFTGLLTLLFITLKLTGVIDWAWWLVLAPVWVAAGLFIAVAVVIVWIVSRPS